MYPRIKTQQGASIVAAIFLIVVLSLLATGMVSLIATSSQSVSHEVTSSKSYFTGRTCLQWARYQMVYNPGTLSASNDFSPLPDTALDKSNCTVDITTIPDHDSNDGVNIVFYNIDVTAAFGSITDSEYSKRKMRMQYIPTGN